MTILLSSPLGALISYANHKNSALRHTSADALSGDKPRSNLIQQHQQQQQQGAPALVNLCITREFTAYMRENGFRLPDYLQRAEEAHSALAATQQQQQQQRSKRAQRQQQPAKQRPAAAAVTTSLTAVSAVALDARDGVVDAGQSTDVVT
jgi:hypothetical protein